MDLEKYYSGITMRKTDVVKSDEMIIGPMEVIMSVAPTRDGLGSDEGIAATEATVLSSTENEPDVSVCDTPIASGSAEKTGRNGPDDVSPATGQLLEKPLQELIPHEAIADVKCLHVSNEKSSSEDGNASATCMTMVCEQPPPIYTVCVMTVTVEVSPSSVSTGEHHSSVEGVGQVVMETEISCRSPSRLVFDRETEISYYEEDETEETSAETNARMAHVGMFPEADQLLEELLREAFMEESAPSRVAGARQEEYVAIEQTEMPVVFVAVRCVNVSNVGKSFHEDTRVNLVKYSGVGVVVEASTPSGPIEPKAEEDAALNDVQRSAGFKAVTNRLPSSSNVSSKGA
jgi:hypothetical protein